MLPLCIGPGQWKAWHNRFHHGRTNRSGEDPDTRVGVEVYRRHRVARIMTAFNPGSGKLASLFFPFVWFSTQSTIVLFHHSKVCRYWPPARRRRQLLQFWSMVSFWIVVAFVVGPVDWLTIHLAPLLVANAILMSYVATNHLLCDATESANDPLANSLSVQVPRFVDWLHLNFSYHVEHHVYPYVNPKHMPRVHEALRERFGARARRIPLRRAVALAYRTPPIHLGERELVDLQLGRVVSTLGPRGEDPEELGEVPLPVTPGSGFKFARRRAKRTALARKSHREGSQASDNL